MRLFLLYSYSSQHEVARLQLAEIVPFFAVSDAARMRAGFGTERGGMVEISEPEKFASGHFVAWRGSGGAFRGSFAARGVLSTWTLNGHRRLSVSMYCCEGGGGSKFQYNRRNNGDLNYCYCTVRSADVTWHAEDHVV